VLARVRTRAKGVRGSGMAGLKSWRELLETPLKEDEKDAGEEKSLRKCEIPETGGFPSSGISQETPMRKPCEIPEKFPEPERQRLVRTGPNTWKEAEWARGLCVFCDAPAVDVIACTEHRAEIDRIVMPWESRG
jgi:hypothetical protein